MHSLEIQSTAAKGVLVLPPRIKARRAGSGSGSDQRVPGKKVTCRHQRQELLDYLVAGGLSHRSACRLLDLNRSTFQYKPRPDRNAELREQLRAFSEKKRRRGSVKA